MNLSKSLKRSFILMGACYAILIIAIVYSFNLANRIFEPVIDDQYYEKGLDFQKVRSADLLAKKDGIQLKVQLLDTLKESEKLFNVKITSPRNNRLKEDSIRIVSSEPASIKNQFEARPKLKKRQCKEERCETHYTANLNFSKQGYWDITTEVTFKSGARKYSQQRVFIIKPI